MLKQLWAYRYRFKKQKGSEHGKAEKQLKIWRIIAILSICALLTVSILYVIGVGYKKASPSVDGAKVLSLWNEGTGVKNSLIDYVSIVTKEGGADYIPVEDRIAVFDMDGTLTCETFYCCLIRTIRKAWRLLKKAT